MVLEYVNVHEDHARLEGRYIDGDHESIDILVGKQGLVQGNITYANGETQWLDTDTCVNMIALMHAPKVVTSNKQVIVNPDWEDAGSQMPDAWVRMPALFNWIKMTRGIGVHEVALTTEYGITYA